MPRQRRDSKVENIKRGDPRAGRDDAQAKVSAKGSARHAPLIFGLIVVAVAGTGFAMWWSTAGSAASRPGEPSHAASGGEALPTAPGLADQRVGGGLEEIYRRSDPAADGWETEVFNDLAGGQLKRLGKLIAHPEKATELDLGKLAAPDFSCGRLRPNTLSEVFRDGSLRVVRGDTDLAAAPSEFQGPGGLLAALKNLAAPLLGSSDVHVKFKLFLVDPTATTIGTTAYFLASGSTTAGHVQQNATWQCRWKQPDGDAPPLLVSISVSDYEEVVEGAKDHGLFADCTEAVLGGNASLRAELLPHLGTWTGSVERALGVYESGYHGVAVGDVNGDGLDDLFLPMQGGSPNKLFLNSADGTAVDVSAAAGVDFLDLARSALIVDLDNDGDRDLVVATAVALMFLSNDGSGKFAIESVKSGESWTSLAAADYDEDGLLDIYACQYLVPYNSDLQLPTPYHDANNGVPNVLFRNEGNWRFEDATARVGLDENNRRFSFAAAWEDYDNDGDLDLYVANDFGRNNLYRNDNGSFVDIAAFAGVEDISAGMSVSWGDYNRDGLVDLYVSNMFSSAGNRITYQRQFKQTEDEQTRARFQRHARGNSLFENQGDGTFRDVSAESAVTMGRWAWSSHLFDINNDALLDIFVTNGFITNEDSKDL